MTRVDVLDDHYLAVTGLVTVAMQLSFFAVAYTCKFDKVRAVSGRVRPRRG